jgi:hypothetical protein
MGNLKRIGHVSGLVVSTFLLLLGFGVGAANNDTVEATVTVQNIAVSVASGSIDYGILGTEQSKGTHSGDLDNTQVVTNDSNIPVDVGIRGYNSAAWTLAGAAGSDAYIHRFCTSSCATPPTNYTALTTSYADLANGVSAAGTVNVDLYLTTPTVSTSFSQQNVDVSVLVTEP